MASEGTWLSIVELGLDFYELWPYCLFNISILMDHRHFTVSIAALNKDFFPNTESSLPALYLPSSVGPESGSNPRHLPLPHIHFWSPSPQKSISKMSTSLHQHLISLSLSHHSLLPDLLQSSPNGLPPSTLAPTHHLVFTLMLELSFENYKSDHVPQLCQILQRFSIGFWIKTRAQLWFIRSCLIWLLVTFQPYPHLTFLPSHSLSFSHTDLGVPQRCHALSHLRAFAHAISFVWKNVFLLFSWLNPIHLLELS